MGWTAPRTYTVGEIITKAILDTHVKDNLRYLKGLDGVPTIESGLIIDNTGGDEYLQIPSLTTTERDALTPVNGMVIYNETTTEFNKYEAGAWVDLADNTDHGGLDGLADDDHTQYQKEDLLTTQGDIPYATAASTWARLAKGTANQFLKMNGGATAPTWGAGSVTSKLLSHTRVINAVDGDVAYSGYGFQPNCLIVFCSGASGNSWGLGDVNLAEMCIWTGDAESRGYSTSRIVNLLVNNEAEGCYAVLKTLDVDGFTLTWTKIGDNANTAGLVVLALA